jgi:predicted outer membrane repeat protein
VLLGDPGQPSSTKIDGQGLGRILSVDVGIGPVLISGFTFRNGRAASPYPGTLGGAVYAQAPEMTISDCAFDNNAAGLVNDSAGIGGAIFVESISKIGRCTFRENEAYGGGGAIFAHFSSLVLEDCEFVSNIAAESGGGAVMIRDNGSPSISNCRFIENQGAQGGALTLAYYVTPQIDDCVFLRNAATGGGAGGAVLCFSGANPTFDRCLFAKNISSFASFLGWGGAVGTYSSFLSFESCTFVDNNAPVGSAVYYSGTSAVHFDRSIIAFNGPGSAAQCANGAGVLTAACTDVFGNTGGDWTTCLPNQDPTNFSANPFFCNPPSDDYSLQVGSPCAPPGLTGCGLVGALPEGCGPVSVDASTWGKIKSKYR